MSNICKERDCRAVAGISDPDYCAKHQRQGRKALVEMMAVNMHSGDHHVDLTMEDAAALATGLAPLVEQIISARVHIALRERDREMYNR